MPASPATLPTLPMAEGEAGRERSHAVRNRAKVLAAAERLFAERGVDAVSMNDVAAAAGVGKGTLFRRFGDRAGLLRALLSVHESAFQEAFIRGPSPLGPGAPAADRLTAFGRGVLAHGDAHGDILVAAETGPPCGRFRSAPYRAYRTHVQLLVREAAPDVDAEYVADALLAALSAELVHYLRTDRGMPLERIADGYEALVGRLLR